MLTSDENAIEENDCTVEKTFCLCYDALYTTQ